MRLEFQKDILKFLAQRKQAKSYLKTIEADLFSDNYDYLAYCIIKGFYDTYGTQPTETEALTLLDREAKTKKKELSTEVVNHIEKSIKEAFKPYKGTDELIKDTLIEQYQIKLTKELFRDKASSLKEADSKTIQEIYREISRIQKLSEKGDEEKEQNRGSFLFKDFEVGNYSTVEGVPTFLKSLNKMTAKGGFASPELIVLMSGPKRFKTGTALNLALGFARDGKNVYYVDTENGQKDIEDRLKQTMLNCTRRELVSGEFDNILEQQVKRYKALGGDFKCDFYPAHTKTMLDIEDELIYLKEEFDYIPDIIFYDNLDNLKPIDKSIKDKRFQIQAVYFDAIRLQKKRGLFGITLSQISRQAVSKRIIEATDIAEDFGKIANCHAAFAICADEYEMKAKVRRICPVVQRQGVDASENVACYVSIDMAKNVIQEITFDEWKLRVDAIEKEGNVDGVLRKKKPTPQLRKSLKDD